jgi:hypothetical protein
MPDYPMTRDACPQCIDDLDSGMLPRAENVQRLPQGAFAPLGLDKRKVCFDCASTLTLMRMTGTNWEQARIAIANDRSEQYRLPGFPIGLAIEGITKPNKEGDWEDQMDWLDEIGLGGDDPELMG